MEEDKRRYATKKRLHQFVSLYIVLAVGALLCAGIFVGCDSGLEVSTIEVAKYPERMSYIQSQDTTLSLDGLKILVTSKDGNQAIEKWGKETKGFYTVEEDVDFSKSGTYPVTISRHDASLSFDVEVIEQPH
jgi:hypothetical protein